MQIRTNQVISIVKARSLLADEANHMTDEEIQKLIEDFDIIAQYSIKLVQEFNNKDLTTD